MSKMALKQKRELLIEMCKIRDELKTNAQLTQEVIRRHLTFLPRQKLYKFRECSDRNFKTLQENCIWMSLASSFPDPFDNTINIDPKENANEIERWLRENYPVFCFDLAKGLAEERGMVVPYTHKDFIEYVETCMDENGELIEEKERAFLVAHASAEELEHVDEIFQQLKYIRDRFAEMEDSTFKNMSDVINQTRTGMREKTLVYCMTERHDNHTLWENYAKNYTGFCVEYSFRNFADIPFEDYKNLVYMFPMTYRRKKPYFNVVPLLDGLGRQFVYKDYSWLRDPELDADLNMQLFYKYSTYEYEHEWRFSIGAENTNKQRFPFVSAVYAGKYIKPYNLTRLCNIAKKLNVPVYKQVLNQANNGFKYEIVQEANL